MAAADQIAALNAELAECRRELGELRLQLDVLSTIDPLTGLLNRNGVLDALDSAADRQRRTSEPFAVLLISVPELDRIRTTYGSLVYADYVRDTGALMGAALRDMDRLGRIDTSTFLVVMPWMGDDGERNCSAGAKIMWDDRMVYVYVRVRDDKLAFGTEATTQWWESDSVEFWIDAVQVGLHLAPSVRRERKLDPRVYWARIWIWTFCLFKHSQKRQTPTWTP